MNHKPFIVISNDDGIDAPGIHHLVEIAKKFGDILVIAPETEHSGQSHSVTVKRPLFAKYLKTEENVKYYSCSGTPVDCLKLGLKMFSDRTPDLVISGINHGSNAGTNVFYSGTMAIAIEAVFEKIPSVGFSYCTHLRDADFTEILPYVESIISIVLEKKPIPVGCCWNVNFPYQYKDGIQGVKICSMSEGLWSNLFEERIIPGAGKPYYWLFGDYSDENPRIGTDEYALQHGYVSVVPITIDITDYKELDKISKLF
ncbi:MAG: 5'/3'-nucleotidase SurE [Bacteroidales bacterium]|jgi:5'-nucleotidase|nr:5'/3'-nucleotidase SurE [Bacteroidales bacterium]